MGYAELCRALDIPVLAGKVTPGNVPNTVERILRGDGHPPVGAWLGFYQRPYPVPLLMKEVRSP